MLKRYTSKPANNFDSSNGFALRSFWLIVVFVIFIAWISCWICSLITLSRVSSVEEVVPAPVAYNLLPIVLLVMISAVDIKKLIVVVVSALNNGFAICSCCWRYYLGPDSKASTSIAISYISERETCLRINQYIFFVFWYHSGTFKTAVIVVLLFFAVLTIVLTSQEQHHVPLSWSRWLHTSLILSTAGNMLALGLDNITNNFSFILHCIIIDIRLIIDSDVFFYVFLSNSNNDIEKWKQTV